MQKLILIISCFFIVSCQKTYKLAIYPASFQPFHNGHYEVIKKAKFHCEHLLIGINHADGEKTGDRNPFYGNDRENMIKNTLEKDGFTNYSIVQYNYRDRKKDGIGGYYESIFVVATEGYRKIFGIDPKDGDIATIYDAKTIHPNWKRDEYFEILQIKPKQNNQDLEEKIAKDFLMECKIAEDIPFGTKQFFDKYKNPLCSK
jgi:cytidyltransferase-like protein